MKLNLKTLEHGEVIINSKNILSLYSNSLTVAVSIKQYIKYGDLEPHKYIVLPESIPELIDVIERSKKLRKNISLNSTKSFARKFTSNNSYLIFLEEQNYD